ncbi:MULTISPECIES: protein adenylyltransferase Fic [Moraxella]|uniref:Protein adenylyltransferase n=1 Tax=Moraxella catarrhalis TaxID=480 RepID=A0A7Z1A3Z5_MORCA|nr:Fic family protein [Moraxella catarrhalis]OAV00919.1 MloA [Moraxella catarrhalis]STY81302.1 Fic/DOC family [Moraxella catarrhalis]
MTFDAEKPFNDLPRLPPTKDIETRTILKMCVEARASLAGLKQAGELIPNQTMLINAIPMLEAKGSSEIENIVTTTDKLFQHAFDDDHADNATKEALRYRTALYDGIQAIKDRPLSSQTALQICQTIKGVSLGVRKTTGTKLQNSLGQTIYTPPDDPIAINELLANWDNFLHADDDLDPLVKMAIAHYQFEAIHPFFDGNGRTGRIINILYLIDKGLLDLPIFYLSRYIINHKAGYYDALLTVTTKGDWETWLVYMLNAIKDTSDWTTAKILSIKQLHQDTGETIKAEAPKIYSRDLLDAIFEMPYCRIANLVQKGLGARQTVSNYLKKLCDIGVLEMVTVGNEKIFINPKLMDLLKT